MSMAALQLKLIFGVCYRGGTIPEITMRYVSRYLSHDTSLMLRLIDYQAKIKEA